MKISLLSSVILSLLILVSCSSTAIYRNDIPCSVISHSICDEADDAGEYSEYGNDHLEFFFGDTALYDDHCVMYSTEVTDINEIGVFHCKDEESAKELTKIVSKYIAEQQNEQKAFIASYAPREVPKLENAEVRRYGNYVIYLILNDDDKQDAIEEIEKLLKE